MSLLEALLYSGKSEEILQKASPASPASPGTPAREAESSKLSEWPAGSADCVARFGIPSAGLYPPLNRKVRTPRGTSVLLEVFVKRATFLLDGHEKVTSFSPDDVCPDTVM